MKSLARRTAELEPQKVNKLLPGHWYKFVLGSTYMYIIRAGKPTSQFSGTFLTQYTDQIRFARKGERVAAAQGVTFQRSWAETMNSAYNAHYPYTPTEEDLHNAVSAVFLANSKPQA